MVAKCPFRKFRKCDPECALRVKTTVLDRQKKYKIDCFTCSLSLIWNRTPKARFFPKFVSDTEVTEIDG